MTFGGDFQYSLCLRNVNYFYMNERISQFEKLGVSDDSCVVPCQVQLTKKLDETFGVFELLASSLIENKPHELGLQIVEVRRRLLNIFLDADDNGVDITEPYKRFIDLESKMMDKNDRRENPDDSR